MSLLGTSTSTCAIAPVPIRTVAPLSLFAWAKVTSTLVQSNLWVIKSASPSSFELFQMLQASSNGGFIGRARRSTYESATILTNLNVNVWTACLYVEVAPNNRTVYWKDVNGNSFSATNTNSKIPGTMIETAVGGTVGRTGFYGAWNFALSATQRSWLLDAHKAPASMPLEGLGSMLLDMPCVNGLNDGIVGPGTFANVGLTSLTDRDNPPVVFPGVAYRRLSQQVL